jgi:hypothetical protein
MIILYVPYPPLQCYDNLIYFLLCGNIPHEQNLPEKEEPGEEASQ